MLSSLSSTNPTKITRSKIISKLNKTKIKHYKNNIALFDNIPSRPATADIPAFRIFLFKVLNKNKIIFIRYLVIYSPNTQHTLAVCFDIKVLITCTDLLDSSGRAASVVSSHLSVGKL